MCTRQKLRTKIDIRFKPLKSDWGDKGFCEEVLRRHGKSFKPVSKPVDVPGYNAPGYCFRNAALIALTVPSYRYVEGVCWWRRAEHSFHHAWVTDNGINAIDPTIEDHPSPLLSVHDYRYFGLEYPTMVLVAAIKRGFLYGIFDGNNDALLLPNFTPSPLSFWDETESHADPIERIKREFEGDAVDQAFAGQVPA